MRHLLSLGLLLLLGCATGEIEIGAGRQFRDGGFSVHDDFNEQGPGSSHGEATNFDFSYTEDDVDSVWVAWTIPLGPRQIEIVSQPYFPPPVIVPPPVEPEEKGKFLHIGGVSIPWAAVIALLGALGLYGGQKTRQKILKRKAAKDAC